MKLYRILIIAGLLLALSAVNASAGTSLFTTSCVPTDDVDQLLEDLGFQAVPAPNDEPAASPIIDAIKQAVGPTRAE